MPTIDPATTTLEQLCTAKEIVVSTGSGGVGKTTTAAAIGAAAAINLGVKVLVLTVDPARRLASALGLERFGNVETRVPDAAFAELGVEPEGEMWVAMLDTKQSWDDLIRLHAPDVETREAILENPLYQNITGRFIGSHDYVAMERLFEIHNSGEYDLIVVDTPPTRNAIDFLDAPERMAEFFSSPLLRWLITPYRSRVFSLAAKPFYSVADRILGSQFLKDIAEFFMLFQTMYDGFVERAEAVTALLGGPQTTFVVVSTLETAPSRETEFFLRVLAERNYHVGALVLNKVLPRVLLDVDGTKSARKLTHQSSDIASGLAEQLDPPGNDAGRLAVVLEEMGRNFLNYQTVARREAEQQSEISLAPDLVLRVPYFDEDIHSVRGLLDLGERIWR